MGAPLIVQLIFFWFWSNIVIVNIEEGSDDFRLANRVLIVLINLISLYFLVGEVFKMCKQRLRYFTFLENLVQVTQILLILSNSIWFDVESESFWTRQTWAALFLWFRFFLYMKSFQLLSWLIGMIIACIYDMASFMIVLFIGVIAFADAFLSIDQVLLVSGALEGEEGFDAAAVENLSGYDKYFKGYVVAIQKSYLVALGEFPERLGSYREGDWLVFFLCSIFNIILLLNLLIAIISETFAAFNENSEQKGYREKV